MLQPDPQKSVYQPTAYGLHSLVKSVTSFRRTVPAAVTARDWIVPRLSCDVTT